MGRLFRWLFALGVLAVIAGACAFAMYAAMSRQSPGEAVRSLIARMAIAGRYSELHTPVGPDDTPRRFTVTLGETPLEIGRNLTATGVIRDPDLFVNFARAERYDTRFQAGIYFVRQTQTLAQIAEQLTDARASHIPFRVLEGWRLEQVVEAIDSNPMFGFTGAEFLAATFQPPPEFTAATGLGPGESVEGFLAPGTYQLPPDVSPEALVEALTSAFLQSIDAELSSAISASGRSLREVVTLASIVQREAVHIDEMPRIAGVYLNRLAIGMKLDADPTVQYALGNSRGVWWPPITSADYAAVNSSYNTYLVSGLPPTPIANPGLDAIRAVVFPTASDFYYFRADCRDDGYHDFARTYEEHLANGC